MKKILLSILLFAYVSVSAQYKDTIQYENMLLEDIKVDTLSMMNESEYLVMFHLRLIKDDKSLLNLSFPEILRVNQKSYIYYWTPTGSIYNFNLYKGGKYRIELFPVCKEALNDGSYYLKYAVFSSDNCRIINEFSSTLFDNQYKRSLFHFCHSKGELYQIFSFSPAMPEKAQDPLQFLPINLKTNKNKKQQF